MSSSVSSLQSRFEEDLELFDSHEFLNSQPSLRAEQRPPQRKTPRKSSVQQTENARRKSRGQKSVTADSSFISMRGSRPSSVNSSGVWLRRSNLLNPLPTKSLRSSRSFISDQPQPNQDMSNEPAPSRDDFEFLLSSLEDQLRVLLDLISDVVNHGDSDIGSSISQSLDTSISKNVEIFHSLIEHVKEKHRKQILIQQSVLEKNLKMEQLGRKKLADLKREVFESTGVLPLTDVAAVLPTTPSSAAPSSAAASSSDSQISQSLKLIHE
jgi:hypothetical protein